MSGLKQHLVLCRPGFSETLVDEFRDRFGIAGIAVHRAAVTFRESIALPKLRDTVFARQYLPQALKFESAEVHEAAQFVLERLSVVSKRNNRQSGHWTLHAFAIDDDPSLHFALKIEKAVMAGVKSKLGDFYRRFKDADAFADDDRTDGDLVVQIFASSQGEIYLSIASVASGISPYLGGVQRMKKIHSAPSRSSSKLVEALVFMGKTPKEGETGVDLGAAPGGWTYVMAFHGVNMTAIDHAELELPPSKKIKGTVTHLKENGLKYLPAQPVDWLCCDMVMGSRQTLEVLQQWFAEGKMKNFVANIKLPQGNSWPAVKEALDLLESQRKNGWAMLQARHLYHDRNEITLMGTK